MQDSAYILAWSPDGQRLAVGSSMGLRLYDTKTLAETATLEEESCCGGGVMTDQILAAIGAKNASVSVWDISTHERLFTLEDDAINFPSLALNPDGKMLATGLRVFTTGSLNSGEWRYACAPLRMRAAQSKGLNSPPE